MSQDGKLNKLSQFMKLLNVKCFAHRVSVSVSMINKESKDRWKNERDVRTYIRLQIPIKFPGHWETNLNLSLVYVLLTAGLPVDCLYF